MDGLNGCGPEIRERAPEIPPSPAFK
ncbi:unnamed protein product [Spirodela intermedia]|uniref:Uncharacterized protein n=1 Tax=Spirodela intermedia TaxID=51605 RepID=A0ABN7EDL5_SPIIN|nr:unnamed protein product [Spirodela intermedia]